jgi:hypothetical protein
MRRRNICIASIAGGLVLVGGAAAAGALPGVASPVAGDHLSSHNVTVPDPDEHASDGLGTASSAGKGADVSAAAQSTDTTGVEKGADVSTLASEGQSQAGVNGSGESAAESAGSAPISTPSDGGTTVADTASDGASTVGTSVANDASSGRSAAGSANAAAAGLAHTP